jgi:hypothetical protein
MLLVPQVTDNPVENLMREPPIRVRIAALSAYLNIALIERDMFEAL